MKSCVLSVSPGKRFVSQAEIFVYHKVNVALGPDTTRLSGSLSKRTTTKSTTTNNINNKNNN